MKKRKEVGWGEPFLFGGVALLLTPLWWVGIVMIVVVISAEIGDERPYPGTGYPEDKR